MISILPLFRSKWLSLFLATLTVLLTPFLALTTITSAEHSQRGPQPLTAPCCPEIAAKALSARPGDDKDLTTSATGHAIQPPAPSERLSYTQIGQALSPEREDSPVLARAGPREILPEEVSSNWWAKVQEKLRREAYDIAQVAGSDGPERIYQAHNLAQNLQTTFTSQGINLGPDPSNAERLPGETSAASQSSPDPWHWRLSLTTYGYEGHLIALDTIATPKMVVQRNRVEYHYRGLGDGGGETSDLTPASYPPPAIPDYSTMPQLVEWYLNDERGLEQGFTLNAPPSSATQSPTAKLMLELILTTDLAPILSDDGQGIDFITAGRVTALRYDHLIVTDAAGRHLPARMTIELTPTPVHQPPTTMPYTLRLIIDDTAAVYPLTIDPLATSPNWVASGENTDDSFSLSVGTAGDVNGDGFADVIVGAPGHNTATGRVYVYYGGDNGLASTPAFTTSGETAFSEFGFSVGTAGDVNGDGFADIIVGARAYYTDTGRVYVYYGGSSGLAPTPAFTASGEAIDNLFGASVGTAGDVNGDGFADIIVGAWSHNGLTGRVYVYHGGGSGLSPTPTFTASGEIAYSDFGYSVGTAGDVNGDGFADIVVGAPGHSTSTNTGRIYLYHGGSNGIAATPAFTASGEAIDNYFGDSVGTAGDVNGDGFADMIVGAPGHNTNTGRVYVYYGGNSGVTATPTFTASGEAAGNDFGDSVGMAGDVNGDGFADIIIGAFGHNDYTGRTYIYYGGSHGLTATPALTTSGEAIQDYFGATVGTAGDVNGDGFADIIVGAYGYNSRAGRAYAYYGSSAGLTATPSFIASGQSLGDQFGFTVGTAGDVNGDGFADIIVGAPGHNTATGRVYVYYGGSSGLAPTPAFTASGETAFSEFGFSAGTAGDVNGDGFADIIVGASGHNNGAGRVYVYYGGSSGLAPTPAFTTPNEILNISIHIGWSVGTAGDINGDGFADIIIGAPGDYANTGRVGVFYGGSKGLSHNRADLIFGEATSDQFGNAVGMAGDVNGDSYADIIVGAPGHNAATGRVYVYYGGRGGLSLTPTFTVSGETAGDQFGSAVGTAGDVNGDSYADIIVGAPGRNSATGQVHVYHGGSGGLAPTPVSTASGETTNNFFGFSASTAGDVNGDGLADIVIGAYGYNFETGRAYIYYGGSGGLALTPAFTASGETTSNFGYPAGTAGDVNGDGFADIIVGASRHNADTGRTYLYSGNERDGRAVMARAIRGDGSGALVQPWGLSYQDGAFQVRMTATDPMGRGRVKLQVEACPPGASFGVSECLNHTSATWTDVTTATNGITLTETIASLSPDTLYRWRGRVIYAPFSVTQPGISPPPNPAHGPWRRFSGQAMEADIRVGKPCFPDITVTSNADSGSGTLRQAILDLCDGGIVDFAPALATQTISLLSRSSTVTEAFGFTALPAIAKTITISGNGVTIERSPNLTNGRLFYVGVDGNLALRNLILQNGLAKGGDGGSGGGGAAGMGGAIFNQGNLTVEGVTFRNNLAQGGLGRSGGGIVNGGGGGGAGGDGGMTNRYPGGAPNGGIEAGNGGFGGGGAGGSSDGHDTGGAGGFGGGGGGSQSIGGVGGFGGGNGGSGSGGGGGGGFGGAIFNLNATLLVTNSTFSGNSARGGDSQYELNRGGNGFGGGIFNLNGTVTIVNSTLVSNTVAAGSGGVPYAAGGGIYSLGDGAARTSLNDPPDNLVAPASLTLRNTIVANTPGGHTDCVVNIANSGISNTGGTDNLIESNGGCVTSDLITTDPHLSLLQDNGGDTPSHALLPNSPAIDAGRCVLTTDQRGAARPGAGSAFCDIGAFELQGVNIDLAITKAVTPTTAVVPGGPITYTLLFTNQGTGKAAGVVITDDMPTTVINLNMVSSEVIITPTAGLTFAWQVQNLTPGAGGTITITGIVSPALNTDTVFSNTAAITTSNVDTTPTNNHTPNIPVNVTMPRLGFHPASHTIAEDGVQALITVPVSPAPRTPVTVDYSTDGGSTTAGADYTPSSGTLTFKAGDTALTFTVPINDDSLVEGSETLILTLSNPSGARLLTDTAVLTIADNDLAGIVVRPTALIISEPSGSAVFTISLNSEPSAAVTVTLTSSDMSECTVPTSATLGSSNWVAGVAVTVSAVDDSLIDGDQPCVIQTTSSSSDSNYDGLDPADVTITVRDEDFVNLTISKSVIPQTQVSYRGQVTYTIVLSNNGSGDAVGVLLTDTLPLSTSFGNWISQPGGATGGPVITWSGTISTDQAITFTFIASQTADYGETVLNTVEYSHGDSGSTAQTAFIVEPAPGHPDLVIYKSIRPIVAVPGQVVTYSIIFSNTGPGEATGVVISDILPLSYLTNLNYIASGVTVTQTNAGLLTYTWAVADLVPGANGAITITGIVSPALKVETVFSNTAIITTPSSEAYPDNNQTPEIPLRVTVPRLGFISTNYTTTEAGGQVAISVTLAPPPLTEVTVDYSSKDGSATAGVDYTPSSGRLTFAIGVTVSTFTVPITDDSLVEGSETLTLTLRNPKKANVLTDTAMLIIADNDIPLVPPVARDDAYSTPEDTPLVIPTPGALNNDTDALTATLLSLPGQGAISLGGDGALVYTPSLNFNGSDSFTYRANNEAGASAPAIVTITVTPVNDPPSFTDLPDLTAIVGQAYSDTILANDVDSGDVLTISAIGLPDWLTLVSQGAGKATLAGTPPLNAAGPHSLTLRASDGYSHTLQSLTLVANKNPSLSTQIYLPLVLKDFPTSLPVALPGFNRR